MGLGHARENRDRAAAAAEAVRRRCWSPERQVFLDNPDKPAVSQHANLLAILYDVAPRAGQTALIDRVTMEQGIGAPKRITGSTFYFSFYLARALEHAGLADRYPVMLATWRDLLRQNFTTWPENPNPTRSDSHAWSAHPTGDLLTLVAGIAPAAPGFRTVRIEPHLGALRRLDAAMAHPLGPIRVRYQRRSGRLVAR